MRLTKELINKEVLEYILGVNIRYDANTEYFEVWNPNALNWRTKERGRWDNLSINIYEFVHKDLKQYTKDNNLFTKINWAEEPKDILNKLS